MKEIIIIGGGGHAKVIASLLNKHSNWNPVGYIDVVDKGTLLGIPYLGNDEKLLNVSINQKLLYAVVGMGQINNIERRIKLVESFTVTDIEFPAIVSKDSIVNEDVLLGKGTVIMDGVVVQPSVRIGEFSIINTGATVDHDCCIGDFVHIAPGVNISGEVMIGNKVHVGTGSILIQGIKVTDNVIIAAGSTVTKDIKTEGIYAGSPAEKKK